MNKKIYSILLLIIAISCLSIVVASDTLEATTSDTFYFYDLNDPASQDGYDAAIVIDGVPYYLDSSDYDKLCDYSTKFAEGFLTQYKDTTEKQELRNTIGMKVGEITTSSSSAGQFELSIDKPIKFTYKEGKVGYNENAHIITSLDLEDD